jgi:hypothetical protein
MIWFVVGFAVVMIVGIAWTQFAPTKVRLRTRKATPVVSREAIESAVKTAERAVYDARSEEEYRKALGELLEISSRSLDAASSADYVERESDNRATG